ncbi:MAG: HlyC/CorC family transporter [Betaproteobacteria bacterium]|nr:HlyC/CorC family transporter [Betaproteobacteria bacterium]
MPPESLLGLELTLLAAMIALNGLFAMSEIAIVSAKKSYLQKLADGGDAGALAALQLSLRPSELLSTVQIGITLIGFVSGIFSGATLVARLTPALLSFDLSETLARSLAAATVVLSITFVTVVFGELIPKRFALHAPEKVARVVARPILFLSKMTSPLVKTLSSATELVCNLLGIKNYKPSNEILGEEIKSLVEQSAHAGAFDETEKRMVEGVLNFSEARVSSFMTPRPELVWLDIDEPAERNRRKIVDARHSHFPVVKGSLENVVGVIHVKDILSRHLMGQPFDLTLSLEQALFLPENADASRSVELFRNSATHFAFVVDEYGNIQGVVTLTDILRAIVGDFADTLDDKANSIVQRKDGSWLVDGLVTVEELRQKLGLRNLHGQDSGNFHTLAGFILSELGKIPKPTDTFDRDGMRFEVVDMDGNRVDKVLITKNETI